MGGEGERLAAGLRAAGLFGVALVVGAGSGLGAVGFRYLVYFFTWVATGHVEFGQQGRVPSAHFPWLGLGFFVVAPVVGGLVYGPLIYRFAREARGHGVPEVMMAVAENGGRIRPQVAAVKATASALCIGAGGPSAGRARSCRSARRWPPAWATEFGCPRAGCECWWPAAPPAVSRPHSTPPSRVCSSGSRSSCGSSPSRPSSP